jgi:hypothetical protein
MDLKHNCTLLYFSVHTAKLKLNEWISGGMDYLTQNQGYTEFNHKSKYDKMIALHSIRFISETMT